MGRISINEVKKRLEKVYSKEPSKKIGIIYDYEKNHRLLVANKFGPFTKYFEDSFDFLLDAIYSINYLPKKNWSWKKNLQYLYFASATKPLFKAFTLTLDGFYDEASAIIRTPYEVLIKIIFCSCYPTDFWITYANPAKGQRTFNLSNFLQNDLKVDWKSFA